MIFVTTGSQMPFDRLIRTVDEWAAAHPSKRVVAQIGVTDLTPANLETRTTMPPSEFARLVADAELAVGHAGMGTILTAFRYGTPVLVLPRRGDLHETRNDHQFATARRLGHRPGLHVALDEAALLASLDRLSGCERPAPIPPYASDELIDFVRGFVHASGRGYDAGSTPNATS